MLYIHFMIQNMLYINGKAKRLMKLTAFLVLAQVFFHLDINTL